MPPITTILCPLEADVTPVSETAVRSAVEVCKRFGGRLVLEHNVDPVPPPSLGVGWMWSEGRETGVEERTERARENFRRLFATVPDSVPVEGKLTRGPIVAAVLQLAEETGADLIVMGSHGPSSAEHESLTEQIVTQSACAAMTTKTDALYLGSDGQIIVAVDFSPASEGALRYAFAIAERVPANLVLLHVESVDDSSAAGGSDRDGVRARGSSVGDRQFGRVPRRARRRHRAPPEGDPSQASFRAGAPGLARQRLPGVVRSGADVLSRRPPAGTNHPSRAFSPGAERATRTSLTRLPETSITRIS
jgi:nucleotide-binding universal stress UspA family protein